MPKKWIAILSLATSSCVFTGEAPDIPAIEDVADADAGADMNPATNEVDATVNYDSCASIARATATLPVPSQDSQAIRESSVFSLFTVDETVDDTDAYGALWAHTLSGAQNQAYLQMQRFAFNGELVEFGELQPATFPVDPDEQILYVLQASDSADLVPNRIRTNVLVVTNKDSWQCEFPRPAVGDQCQRTTYDDFLRMFTVWPIKKAFVGAQRPLAGAAFYVGFEGGEPSKIGAFVDDGTRVPPFVPVVGAFEPTIPSSAEFLWGFDRADGEPYLAATVRDGDGPLKAGFTTATNGEFRFTQEQTVEIPSYVDIGLHRIALANTFVALPERFQAESPRFGYFAVPRANDRVIMGAVGTPDVWQFAPPSGQVSQVFTNRDVIINNPEPTLVPATVFFLWGDNGRSQLAAGRSDFDGNGHFADSIFGTGVDEILDVALGQSFLGRSVVAARVKRGAVVDVRVTRVNLDPSNANFCVDE